MKPASLNHAYRLVWSELQGAFVAVAETARSKGKRSGPGLISALLAAWMAAPALAANLPTGGQIVAGDGSISQSGTTMTVTQNSERMAADWLGFSIGAGHAVNFVQPSASAIALNRVLGSDVSVIQGALTANGLVFLINPNGVLFSPTAQVDVGGLVASTLNLATADFMAGSYRFAGNSSNAIIHQGNMKVSAGGTAVLIGARIINSGEIHAPGGGVLIGAGQAVTLDLGGPVKLQVTQGAIDALIDQGGALRADGGLIYLSAQAAGELASAVINHTGVSEAKSLATGETGEIWLMGDMAQGTVSVGGSLSAAGGFIETSAATVNVLDGAHVKAGHWLIDPTNLVIDSAMAATLQGQLASGDATVQTAAGGGDAGDLTVNASVAWSQNKFTLSAHRNIAINASLNGSGSASLALEYGQGAVNAGNTATYRIASGVKVNLPAGQNFSTRLGTDGSPVDYTVITALGDAGSTTATDLQGINGGTAGNYALGADVDASATSGWSGGEGFTPISVFSGRFDGLGHRIANLSINRPGTDFVGLFGDASAATLANMTLTDVNITGRDFVGALAGRHMGITGSISHASVSGSVSGRNKVGGLAGWNNNIASDISSSVTVSASGNNVGGLIGENHNALGNAWASGNVTGNSTVGGLLGYTTKDLLNAFATGNVTGAAYVGGLVGAVNTLPTLEKVHATGNVTGAAGGDYIGGLVGSLTTGTLSNAWASGNVSGGRYYIGGLAGQSGFMSTISNSHASGAVSGVSVVGGLVGRNGYDGSTTSGIYSSYASGNVTASAGGAGGLVGWNAPGGDIQNSYATGNVTVATNQSGGLVGYNDAGANIATSYASGRVAGSTEAGGLVGASDGTISASYWDMTTSERNTGGCGTGTCTGFNRADAYTQATYAGFDFGTVWWMSPGATRPMLRSEYSTSITNPHQLQLMALNPAASYVLAKDIDLAPALGRASEVWAGSDSGGSFQGSFVSVGDNAIPFSGRFDGQGHRIANLTVVNTGGGMSGNVGLFGKATDAHFSNVSLTNVNMTGFNLAGGLVGGNFGNGSISRVHVDGRVTGSRYLGGVVGRNDNASITDVHAQVEVSGGWYIGGLAGYANNSAITHSSASGNVTGGRFIGGLAGFAINSSITDSSASGGVSGGQESGGLVGYLSLGSVARSWASGNVSSNGSGTGSYMGGLAGFSTNTIGIINTYATGAVTGLNNVGGLVGFIGGGQIANSYATGRTIGASEVGGLAGYSEHPVIASYWDTQSTGQAVGCGNGCTGGTGYTGAQIKSLSSFAGWDIDDAGGTGKVWRIYDGDTAPLLRSLLTPLTVTSVTGGSKVHDGSAVTATPAYAVAGSHDATKIIAGGSVQGRRDVGNYTIAIASTQKGYDLIGTRSAAYDITPSAPVPPDVTTTSGSGSGLQAARDAAAHALGNSGSVAAGFGPRPPSTPAGGPNVVAVAGRSGGQTAGGAGGGVAGLPGIMVEQAGINHGPVAGEVQDRDAGAVDDEEGPRQGQEGL